MSKPGYNFIRSREDGDFSYSFTLPDEASPTDVYEQFCHFLTAVYGWDVRKHIYEDITTGY